MPGPRRATSCSHGPCRPTARGPRGSAVRSRPHRRCRRSAPRSSRCTASTSPSGSSSRRCRPRSWIGSREMSTSSRSPRIGRPSRRCGRPRPLSNVSGWRRVTVSVSSTSSRIRSARSRRCRPRSTSPSVWAPRRRGSVTSSACSRSGERPRRRSAATTGRPTSSASPRVLSTRPGRSTRKPASSRRGAQPWRSRSRSWPATCGRIGSHSRPTLRGCSRCVNGLPR